ncbi:MAG: hypothetical protein PHS24_05185 [Bacilli bacterium]|nr:hypothetical protein [Bacilli bacterium]
MKIKFKKTIRNIIIAFISLLVLGFIFANIDYSRTKKGKPPILAIRIGNNKYTNADMYYGLGYSVIKCPEYENNETKYQLRFLDNAHACASSFDVEISYNLIKTYEKKECDKKPELYFTENERNIYLYCFDKVEVIKNEEVLELDNYLKNNNETIDDFVNLFSELDSFWDGGSKIYREIKNGGWYGNNYKVVDNNISILKCNTLNGNKDVYIGNKKMSYEDGFCS